MNIENLYREEIAREFEKLKEMELGSDEYKVTVDGVTELTEKVIEMDRLNHEKHAKLEDRMTDNALKMKQMDDDRKFHVVKIVLDGVSIVLPLGVAIWGTIVSINFEKEGTITTHMGRGWLNKLLPRK